MRPDNGAIGCCEPSPESPASCRSCTASRASGRLPELELDWLPGYEGSVPVRCGNEAARQYQLDVYGEVFDALYHGEAAEMPTHDQAWPLQQALMDFLESGWKQPDDGIWEVRGQRRHFTHSKVMAWVAADRAVRAVEQLGAKDRSTSGERGAPRSSVGSSSTASTTGGSSSSTTAASRSMPAC